MGKTVDTKIIHDGSDPKKHFGSINDPIYKNSTLIFDNYKSFLRSKKKKFDVPYYGRISTYTTRRFEELISKIYDCKVGVVTSSGLSAITLTLLSLLKKNDEIILTENCYEPVYNFAENELKRFGINSKYFGSSQNETLQKLLTTKTKVIYIESPGSLNFEVEDLKKIVSIAKPRKILTVMDNTWSTFLGCNPLKYGIDIVIESATKYLSGHSDNFLGIIALNSDKYRRLIKQSAVRIGDFVSAESCFEASKGLKTLKIRMEKHQYNAKKIFNYLKSNKIVTDILYLPDISNKSNKLWKKFHKINNGLITFSIRNNGNVNVFVDSLKLFKIGFSWGGYESLILPLESLKPSRKMSKNKDYWFRIHIGLENYEDLIRDINNAMSKYAKQK